MLGLDRVILLRSYNDDDAHCIPAAANNMCMHGVDSDKTSGIHCSI